MLHLCFERDSFNNQSITTAIDANKDRTREPLSVCVGRLRYIASRFRRRQPNEEVERVNQMKSLQSSNRKRGTEREDLGEVVREQNVGIDVRRICHGILLPEIRKEELIYSGIEKPSSLVTEKIVESRDREKIETYYNFDARRKRIILPPQWMGTELR